MPIALWSATMQHHGYGEAMFGTGSDRDAWRGRWRDPARIARAFAPTDVAAVVDAAEDEALAGRTVVLLLSYEAAPAFDAALRVTRGPENLPLAWMAAYDSTPEVPPVPAFARVPAAGVDSASAPTLTWRPAIDEARFARDIAVILARIHAGDTYQVNYTFPLHADGLGEPAAWFKARARDAEVPFAAYVDLGSHVVMSLSPELFLTRTGRQVTTRPMKGTSRRGRWLAEDQALAQALVTSDKARAENVMIVDLLRNDLGRVAEIGSVRVRELCRLERYPTVWQLTSTIDAVLRPDVRLLDLLHATFPCGSVTGAPKVRTTEIIASLEQTPRGRYTGAICLLQPGGDVVASVPIRTAVLDRQTGVATFRVGAGIVADSSPAEEWAECLAKARVVRAPAVPADVELFETLRLDAGALARHDAHVNRLAASAELCGWRCDRAALHAHLARLAAAHPAGVWRVRLRLAADGRCRTEAEPFVATTHRWRVGVAPNRVDARDPLLFNKTTRRGVYDAARAARPDCDDVLLVNLRDELTESTIASLVVELDGVRVTPPIGCGLLPGILRAELVARGEVVEQVIPVADLWRASRIWLVNALRGWIDVDLVDRPDTP
ncbi:MAG: aminodeoxychorismate synthase component I [Luteitalea sp.]